MDYPVVVIALTQRDLVRATIIIVLVVTILVTRALILRASQRSVNEMSEGAAQKQTEQLRRELTAADKSASWEFMDQDNDVYPGKED